MDGARTAIAQRRRRRARQNRPLGITEDEDRVARALMRARRHAGSVIALVPQVPSFAVRAETELGRLVTDIMTREHRRGFLAAKTLLNRHGVRVVAAGPGDTPARLLAGVGRPRPTRRAA